MHNLQLKQICENDKPMKKKKKKMKGLLTCLSVQLMMDTLTATHQGSTTVMRALKWRRSMTPKWPEILKLSTREWVQETEWNGMMTVVSLGVSWVLSWVGSVRSSPI